jgi:hypothetical protein
MFASPIMNFKQLCNNGMRIEDAIGSGRIDKNKEKISAPAKKTFGSSSKAPANIQANINVVQPNQYQHQRLFQNQYQNPYSNPPKQALKPKRYFDPLGAPLSIVLDHMCKRGHLKPLDPVPPLNLLLKHWDTNLYCHFDQRIWHNTDDCSRLKHEIQDLIANDVILKPRLANQPNVHKNPLPNYQRTPPPNQSSFIEAFQGDWVLAIDDEAWDDFMGDDHVTRIST